MPGLGAGAPLSLTASDGTGLVLSGLKASAVVSGPLGFTELHLTFDNPEDRTLEGRFEITLPTGAAVSRFAMLMTDGWREAEVVERQRARVAYEDFLHRRQDPALLEREAGNKFSARVFPIPARGRKELKLSYSQELAASDKPYRLPLAGLPKLGRLEIVAIAGDEVTQVIKQDFQPQQDYEVRAPQRTLASAQGLRSDRLAVARIKVSGQDGAKAGLALDRVLLLVDTSASRAAGFDKQIELVGSLVEEIKKAGAQSVLQVAAFDQAVAPIFSGAASGFGRQHLDALRARGPLGASDIEGALRFAKSASGVSRILLITDGIATAYGGAGEQRAALQDLPRAFQRLDVVMVGGIRDEVGMRSLAASVLAQPGIVLDGAQAPGLLADRLRRSVLTDVKVVVAGAKWHWPQALDGVQPGDEVLVFAELEDKDLGQSLKVQLAGAQTTEVALAAASGPLLERATAQALVQSLTHEHEQLLLTDKPAAAALREDIIKLSTRHRVLSDFTALLVLETEQDYARFNLDRRALADILTIGDRGIELFHRPPPEPPQVAQVTQGEQGPGTAEVRGPLDKDVIRRIIRRHINEVKFCYEKELVHTPNLDGRVSVRFVIGTSGSVTESTIASSTMNHASMEQCLVSAVRRWEFPKPQGAEVTVTYPFVLKAAGDDSPPPPVNQDIARARPRAAPPSDSLFAIRGPAPAEPSSAAPAPDPQSNIEEARNHAREAASTSGILGVTSGPPGGMASIFGRDSALGAEADSKLGGLVGTEVGDAYGAGGFGLVGSGQGGGGTGEGTIGLGNLGTIGRGGGHAYGSKSGTLRNRRSGPVPITVPGTAEVRGSLDKELIRRIIRRHINEVKFCYERELSRNPSLQGRVMIQFTIAPTGMVPAALVQASTLNNPSVEQCIAGAVRRWEFPHPPGGGIVVVSYPFVLKTDEDFSPPAFPNRPPSPSPSIFNSPSDPLASGIGFGAPKQNSTPSYTGTMLEVMTHLEHQRTQEALAVAQAWRKSAPGDVLALTALGAAQDAAGNKAEAERAFGSILDLYPSRADLRRYAGSRLESLRGAASEGSSALRLAADTYLKAVEQRPDHPNSHRLRAYALLKLAQPAEAFAALRKGLNQRYPGDRFRGVDQILREDLGLVAAAWRKAEPDRAEEIQKQLSEAGVPIAVLPSLRFILSWETDANDVDFHIHDGKGGHAYYSQKELPSGGELYADVTTGYGPECFAIRGTPAAFPYRLEAHYYSRGPMGYGMGKLQILSHDGKGGMRFEDRPFVVMNDGAYVNLGSLEKPLHP